MKTKLPFIFKKQLPTKTIEKLKPANANVTLILFILNIIYAFLNFFLFVTDRHSRTSEQPPFGPGEETLSGFV